MRRMQEAGRMSGPRNSVSTCLLASYPVAAHGQLQCVLWRRWRVRGDHAARWVALKSRNVSAVFSRPVDGRRQELSMTEVNQQQDQRWWQQLQLRSQLLPL